MTQRDAEHDVGRLRPKDKEPSVKKTPSRGLLDLVAANAKRIEESLRVIEELAKLPEMNSMLNSAGFEQTRFTFYAVERELISRISRRDKIEKLPGLYVILDRQFLTGRDELEIAGQVINGGATAIQLRDKESGKGELLLLAQNLKELCGQAGVLFIVNDYLDLALAVAADGIHVGQKDLPLPVVRRQLPVDTIIGCSVTTLNQAIRAQDDGADYIAVGSMFPTTTKKQAVVVGVDRFKELRRVVSIPLVVIGGINQHNIGEVVAAGAHTVAVVGAVLGEKDVRGAVQRLVAEMNLVKEKCQNQ
jgi:thiamine-phosphate pyrophosphorylase